jgi:hypothetical protein
MVDRRWMEIECFHMLGGPESKRLKDAAPNLFHPTASLLFRKAVFLMLRHSLWVGEGWSEGIKVLAIGTLVII